MFMVVTYPWPVSSAHVELTGPQLPDAAATHADATEDGIQQCSLHIEEIVRLSDREWLQFQWYRLRLAIAARHVPHVSR
jgi:hypothetical protein